MEIKSNKRPWGSFRQFTKNEISTVKLINVQAGHKLSLQYHHRRNEFWVVIIGNPKITIGEEVHIAKARDEFEIPTEVLHRIEAPDGDVQILEISFGEFDEDDIVRIEDAYGRIS
jgi:mannose-6-phosphate isomerase-like protein (cupin superfamily)